MKNTCAKCKKDTKEGSSMVEGGKVYRFCKTCSKILHSFQMPTNIIPIFLKSENDMSDEMRNIFEARKRRAEGQTVWAEKPMETNV